MKHCTYCGKEHPDNVSICAIDGHAVQATGNTPLRLIPDDTEKTQLAVPPAEQSFWERMSFRQFAILIVRLQAVWLLFYAALDATYLPFYYLNSSYLISSLAALSPGEKLGLSLRLLRIAAHVGGAFLLIQKTERVLSWLVKDLVQSNPDNSTPPRIHPTNQG